MQDANRRTDYETGTTTNGGPGDHSDDGVDAKSIRGGGIPNIFTIIEYHYYSRPSHPLHYGLPTQ